MDRKEPLAGVAPRLVKDSGPLSARAWAKSGTLNKHTVLLYHNDVYGTAGKISPQTSEASLQRPLSPVIPPRSGSPMRPAWPALRLKTAGLDAHYPSTHSSRPQTPLARATGDALPSSGGNKQILKPSPKPNIDSPIIAWGPGTADQERAPARTAAAKLATATRGGRAAAAPAEEMRGMRREMKAPASTGTFAKARPAAEVRLPAVVRPAADRQLPFSRQFPPMPPLNLVAASPQGLSPQTSADVRYVTEGLGKPVALQPRRTSANSGTASPRGEAARSLLSPRASLAASRIGSPRPSISQPATALSSRRPSANGAPPTVPAGAAASMPLDARQSAEAAAQGEARLSPKTPVARARASRSGANEKTAATMEEAAAVSPGRGQSGRDSQL